MKANVKFRPSRVISDVRVFAVIDAVRKRVTGNWLFTFTRATEILAVLSEQFGFRLKEPDNPDVERLDRILARKAINLFNQPLMDRFIEGIQVQSVFIDDADEFEEAVQAFLPHTMRFAGRESSVVFQEFMENAANLDYETPHVFGPSPVSGKYTSRLPFHLEIQPEWQEKICKLNQLAIATHRSWAKFVALVRTKWPDLILELHGGSD
jgi:hypothetical protein